MTEDEQQRLADAVVRLKAVGIAAGAAAQAMHAQGCRLAHAGASGSAFVAAWRAGVLQGGAESPDTPLEEWLAGVDTLLEDLKRKDPDHA